MNNTVNIVDEKYLNLCNEILSKGKFKKDRTGTGTISISGTSTRYDDVSNYFPLLTTKKVHFKSVVGELLWFLSGSTNANELEHKYKCTIWREWARENGDLGPVYGHQWRNFNSAGKDQITYIIEELKNNPLSRRCLVSAWNPEQLEDMALPPCHYAFQFVAEPHDTEENKYVLNIIVSQRSCDVLLGNPFNISSYALLLLMIAKEVGMYAGSLIHNIGDAHIYSNHLTYIKEQMKRTHFPSSCTVKLNENKSIFEYELEDIVLENYVAHPNWKNIPVAV